MAYPLISDLNTLVRYLLKDTRVSTGEVFTDAKIAVVMPMAWREMWEAMILWGVERPKAIVYHLLPAHTMRLYPELAGVTNFHELLRLEEATPHATSYTVASGAANNGSVRLETSATHALNSNDRVFITNLNETANGEWLISVPDTTHIDLNGSVFFGSIPASVGKVYQLAASASFTDVVPARTWTRSAPGSTLGTYRIMQDHIQLHGATAARLLAIEANLTAPAFPTSTSDKLRVDNCDNFIAYRTAALLARAQGREDLANIYDTEALGAHLRADGAGGFLAGLRANTSKSAVRQTTQRPIQQA